ncbi:MAG: HEAT repeat domain-containing protein [Aridibacter sp.]
MINKNSLKLNILTTVSLMFFIVMETYSQMPPVRVPQETQQIEEDFTWWYIMLFVLAISLAGAIYWVIKSKKAETFENNKRREKNELKKENWDANSVDAGKELEWFRKNSKAIGKTNNKTSTKPIDLPKTSKILNKKVSSVNNINKTADPLFEDLPISSFTEILPAKDFDKLALSNDSALISAIEQTQDEYEEDEEIRSLAVRILAAFRNRNSIEALSQVALYDLSSNLRSKAVLVLAEFDHESTFEAILIACADPTREVRAAAAKALFSVSFDRGNAWTRIAETNDEFRIIQAARAAIESDLVDRSIDRLVHPDRKYAYEAFALIALLIKAGEIKEIFDAIENHRDKQVKLAILQVLKVVSDEKTLPALYQYVETNSLPDDLGKAANDVIKSFDSVAA